MGIKTLSFQYQYAILPQRHMVHLQTVIAMKLKKKLALSKIG